MGASSRNRPRRLAMAAAAACLSACAGPDMAAFQGDAARLPVASSPQAAEPSSPGSVPVRFTAEGSPSPADPSDPTDGDTTEGGGPAGPLEITVDEAVLLALENNRPFRIDRLRPSVKKAAADEARAAFDVTVSADASAVEDRGGPYPTTIEGTGVGLSRRFPGGTTVGVEVSTGRRDTFGSPDTNALRFGVEVAQPVLKGAGREVGLATIRQAVLDVRLTEHELEGLAEALVARAEEAYWDYVLAGRQIEIFDESLGLAEKQLEETRERIRIGSLAETEAAAARAETALRREQLIDAKGDLDKARLRLLRLMGSPLRGREVIARSPPTIPETALAPPEDMVARALTARADLAQARLEVERGELEVVKTRNGLLPRLDLFLTLGKSGYSDTITGAAGDIGGEGYDAELRVAFAYALGGRASKARQKRAVLSRDQAEMAVENLRQLAELEVRTARIEAERTREQIDATRATRESREEAFRAESEKLLVGISPAILVALAQRDLVASRVSEVRALVGHLKARVDLYRAEGTLLERRGISMGPGSGGPSPRRRDSGPAGGAGALPRP